MNRARWFGWAALLGAAVVPLLVGDYLLYLLTLIGAYGVVALGLNLLTGLSGQISLGHAGFFAIGAYVATVATSKYGLPYLAGPPLRSRAAGSWGSSSAFPPSD